MTLRKCYIPTFCVEGQTKMLRFWLFCIDLATKSHTIFVPINPAVHVTVIIYIMIPRCFMVFLTVFIPYFALQFKYTPLKTFEKHQQLSVETGQHRLLKFTYISTTFHFIHTQFHTQADTSE